ncbi:MAG: FAD-dependent oxidoreductase [Owenweeksia sp.]|nr:FAD-dependent oxidoreductase [Owenweeksia sp.]
MEHHFDLGIIGGGIVGLATAYKYQLKNPEKRIAILEKENRVAAHQTGRNSGVIHSGIYYKPGSYKAQNCVEGRKQLVAFALKHNIPHDVCGKIILATHDSEKPALERIYQRGIENGIEGIEKNGPEKIHALEPYARGVEAIHVPVTGIIDFTAVCEKLVALIRIYDATRQLYLDTGRYGFLREKWSQWCGNQPRTL